MQEILFGFSKTKIFSLTKILILNNKTKPTKMLLKVKTYLRTDGTVVKLKYIFLQLNLNKNSDY